jgi:vacuolar protein sorting-associated protein 13A/C
LPSPNKLSIQLVGPSWETMKALPVDREGTRTYVLRPNINQVRHRLVCDVKIKNNIKYVTFRSTTILQNLTHVSVDIQLVNSQGESTSGIFNIGKLSTFVFRSLTILVAPGEELSLPILASFYDNVVIRPCMDFRITIFMDLLMNVIYSQFWI